MSSRSSRTKPATILDEEQSPGESDRQCGGSLRGTQSLLHSRPRRGVPRDTQDTRRLILLTYMVITHSYSLDSSTLLTGGLSHSRSCNLATGRASSPTALSKVFCPREAIRQTWIFCTARGGSWTSGSAQQGSF